MSQALAYSAAEYFVEALKKNATFSISYHDVSLLLPHASQDLNSYFQKEGKDDVLFIFKKFPDVFLLNGSDITLTDAFLALYAFPESAEFHTTYKCHSVFVTSIVEFFKLILVRCGACNYRKLFSLLLTLNNHPANFVKFVWQNHFFNFTEADMHEFFLKYKSTFTLINDNVYLNRSAPINFETFDDHFCEKSLKKLIETTCFLLTCFDSLHYIELRQVISFVVRDVMEYLNMYSLIKQREIFENLPHTAMDKMGYVSLKSFKPPLPKSRNVRLTLLIVCILAFEKEIHILKICNEIRKRAPFEVSSILCNLSVSGQLKYFRELPDFFWIYDDGYITLLPSFVFPFCSFDSNSLNAHTCFLGLEPSEFNAKSNDLDIIEEIKKLSIEPTHISNLGNSGVDANVLPEEECILPEKEKSPNKLPKNIFVHNVLPSVAESAVNELNVPLDIYEKLQLSIIWLQKWFDILCTEDILKSFLYAVSDIQTYFVKLSATQQKTFILNYFQYTSSKSFNEMSLKDSQLTEEEEVILATTFLLIQNKKMHYGEIVKELKAFKISASLCGLEAKKQFEAFKSLSHYFDINGKGQVYFSSAYSFLMSIINPILINRQLKKNVLIESDRKNISSNNADGKGKNQGINIPVSADDKSSESSAISMIIDLSVAVLSISKKMKVEKLCNYLNSSSVENVTNYFSFHTVSEKTNFFSSIPEYFEVSSEGFVSLTKGASSYVPKTNLIIQDNKGGFPIKVFMPCMPEGLSNASDSSTEDCNPCNENNTTDSSLQNIKTNVVKGNSSINSFTEVATLEANNQSILASQDNEMLILSAEDATNIIIDLSVCILSFNEKLIIERLCKKIKDVYKRSFGVKNIFKYVFHSSCENIKLFLNYPEFFEVSPNEFVSLKRNVVSSYVPKTNLIMHGTKGHFVFKSVQCSSSSESVIPLKVKPTDGISKRPLINRPTINSESLKGLRNLLISSKNTTRSTTALRNNELKIKPNAIHNTIEQKFLNFSINESENAVSQNFVSDTNRTINIKHQTDYLDSTTFSADFPFKTCESVAYSKSSLPRETKLMSEEIKSDCSLNYNYSVTERESTNINSMERKCNTSDEYKFKQNLNTSSMQENTFYQNSVKDSDDKSLFSSDDNLDPYTMYGLELLNSFLGESVPHTSSFTDHNVRSQNWSTVCDSGYSINNQKLSSASSSSSSSVVQDNIRTNNQFLGKAIPSKSEIPLQQLPDFDTVEIQAVNFFSVILGNYETGVSADFLMKHLNLASDNVQNFMLRSFQIDAVPFFMKHEAAFYVSPTTQNIYLVKNA